MSSKKTPSCKNHRASVGVEAVLPAHTDEHAELVSQTANVMCNGHGSGAETGCQIAKHTIADLLLRTNGEQLLVLVVDCASKNYIGLNIAGLPQLLVDAGLFKCVVMVFLEINHSKHMADRVFGARAPPSSRASRG